MAKMQHLIQRVEILSGNYAIHCPFCGANAVAAGDAEEMVSNFCEHVLFMGHDEGFEFRSARFDSLMNISGIDTDQIKLGKKGVDGYTDEVVLRDSVKFALYVPAPSFFGAYIGFAPTNDK